MPAHYTIAQITDCHLFADANKKGYAEINPYQSLKQVLAELNRQKPDCVLVTGDVSGDSSAQSYQHFRELWRHSGITAPLLGIAGNHDNILAWQQCFDNTKDHQQVELPVGNWQLHLLQSEFERANGSLKLPAMQDMFAAIRAQSSTQHIVALHHPLTDANVWMDKHNLINANNFIEQLPLPNLRGVLHGHVHTERKVLLHNTAIYACPSTCWQWGNSKAFSVSEQAPGYRIIRLSDDGELSTSTHYLAQ